MSSTEAIYLANQVIENLERLRRDIRANAADYVVVVTDGRGTVEQVAGLVAQDAAAYARRTDVVADLLADTDRGRPTLLAGLGALGIAEADLTTICTELTDGISAQAAASIATLNDLMALRDALLASVSDHLCLW